MSLRAQPRAASPGNAGGLRRRAPGERQSSAGSVGFATEEETEISDLDVDDAGMPPRPRDPVTPAKPSGGGSPPAESRMRKMMVRAVFGTAMMVTFAGVIYLGHVYICMLVFLLQSWIFAELVGVRKKQAAERKLPLFRSLQWAWFLVAAFFTWSANVCEFIGKRPKHFAELESESWSAIARFMLEKNMMISFSMYMGLMIVSVLSLRKGLYKYQIQQYTWTIVTICIVVFQTQAVFQIVYAGLFWFVLPSSLVICNDIMAYYCGQLLGKKLTSRKFLELSPNKTWEGFLGSAICTLIFAFIFSKWLCGFDWMTCVPEDMTLKLDKLTCTPAQMYRPLPLRVFLEDSASLREPLREVLAVASRSLPSVVTEVEVCAAQLHALCLGLFASFAAPFGGFLSSAIKRAYGIKDFNNLIPGHGGMMDRFDCQFVMFLCTFVHYRTFCYSPISVDALLASAAQLSLAQQKEVVKRLQAQLAAQEVGLM